MIRTWTCGGKVYNFSDTYCAFIRDQNNKLVANLTLTEDHDESLEIATLMAKAPKMKQALEYLIDMFKHPHRGNCGTTVKDAENCIAGLECEIEACVTLAKEALK